MAGVRVFPSKVDWWIAAVLVLPPAAALAIIAGLQVNGEAQGAWGGWVVLGVVVAIYGGLVFPMRYELHDDALVIRFGLVRSRVPYHRIRQVVPTRNPLSSPALSLDRLHVDAGSALGPNISPADKAGFLAALAEHTPHLRLAGDRLLPR